MFFLFKVTLAKLKKFKQMWWNGVDIKISSFMAEIGGHCDQCKDTKCQIQHFNKRIRFISKTSGGSCTGIKRLKPQTVRN